MKKKNISAFLVTHDDHNLLENTPKNFERLNWIIGFSGSAGYLIITLKNLYLFIDGRYTVQAKIQTKELKVKIYNISEINFADFILSAENKFHNLAIDVKTISLELYHKYIKAAKTANLKIININKNLIDFLWKRDLKVQKTNKIFILEKKYSGLSHISKLNLVLDFIKMNNSDAIFIQNSESVAWLFNIRGFDLPYTPITFAYTLISKKYTYIFLEDNKLPRKIKEAFSKKIKFLNIDDIPKTLLSLKSSNFKVLIDPEHTNKFYYDLFSQYARTVKLVTDPVSHYKSIKNTTEIKNIFKAHIIDGIALTKFIYWLKHCKQQLSELDVVKKIDSLRARNQSFLCNSFPTIAGSGANGGIIHYIPNKISNRSISENDILLLDSGGQYKLGTTDVTRTFAIGKPKNEQAVNYTLVLKGHIKLSNAIFPAGTTGAYLDYLARSELWCHGKDFNHGTGHGVGFCLNVHEGPFSISKSNRVKLEDKMVFSNEPGYYLEKKYGIRIENLVTTKKILFNKKHFFKIETLTLAPYDVSLIKKNLLSEKEISWIRNYHIDVYKKLSPYLLKQEKNWLLREIKKI